MKVRKLLSLASAAILGLSAIPMSVSAADNVDANGRDLRYDMNMDGEVNQQDVYLISSYYSFNQTGGKYGKDDYGISKQYGMTDEVYANIEVNGDINSDGEIDTRDATLCLKYLEETDYLFGDMNQDGVINAIDASIILSCYAKAQTTDDYLLCEEYVSLLIYGDANHDGFIDSTDASIVLSTYAENQTT